MPEKQVGHYIEVLAEREILKDRGDAHVERRGGIVEGDLPAVEFDRA